VDKFEHPVFLLDLAAADERPRAHRVIRDLRQTYAQLGHK